MANIISIAYTVPVSAFISGIIITYFIKRFTNAITGSIMGFTGGILLSFVCFEILPVAFMTWGLYLSLAGILLGVGFCVLVENYIDSSHKNNTYENKLLTTGILIGLGMSLHNIPEGIALGSMLKINYALGIKFSFLIAVHCLPEALAICIPLRKSGFSNYYLIMCGLIFGIPMAAGAFFGGILSAMSGMLVALSLSFAGGVMLYISCGHIFPEHDSFYSGKVSTVLSCFGFIVGLLVINYL